LRRFRYNNFEGEKRNALARKGFIDEESDGFMRSRAAAILNVVSKLMDGLGKFSGEPYEVYLNILLESYIKGFIANFPKSIVTNILKIDHQKLIDRSAYIKKQTVGELAINIDNTYQNNFKAEVKMRTVSEANDLPMKITIGALFLVIGYNKLKSLWA